jgi:sarcosine oxidase subunit beta
MARLADAVIIGGGCMGASVAFHLTRLGVTNVVLVERGRQLAAGSTGRNAGGVRHQFSHEANIQLSIESIRMLERFEAETGYPADLRQDGYLFLLSTLPSVELFKQNVSRQRRLGVDVEWLTAADAERLAPGLNADGVLAATFCDRDGIADPNSVTTGFAKAAQTAGATISCDTEAIGIRVENDRAVAVETSLDLIHTPVVVNAAGPHARIVGRMAGADVPVYPYRRHIFLANPTAGIPTSRVMVIDFESTFYFHREGPGVLFGMGAKNETSTFDTTVQWDFLHEVVDTAMRRLPALKNAAVTRAWAGSYEVTPDANPIIGPTPGVDGFFQINGFSGHGFQHSPAAGRIVADLIAGRDPRFDLSPFAADRFARNENGGERYVV